MPPWWCATAPTGKQLVGYVVAAAAAGLDRRLKADLQRSLPDYMVPAQILVLPSASR